MSKRTWIFVTVCLACAAALVVYLYFARKQHPESAAAGGETGDSELSAEARGLRLFFRWNGVDNHYGQLAYLTLGAAPTPQYVDLLPCEVVHVSGGRGMCLTADRGVFTTYAARVFDATSFQTLANVALNGIPSRTRVSLDGKVAATTVFVSGHSYSSLDFSTQTLLVDTTTGQVLADLESFTVMRDGKIISSPDFNFWGVTFTPDARHFFATLSTNRKHFLVKGDIGARTATVLHANVECPSLSPDATRVAYKQRSTREGRAVWQLSILELASHRETPLAEERSIDDQLEWLDNETVLYAVPQTEMGETGQAGASTDVWRAAADGRSAPRLFLRNAYSPAVARNPATGATG